MRIYALKPSPTADSSINIELLRSLKPHSTPVVTLTIDHTGTLLATGGADGQIRVWDIRGGYATHTFRGQGGVISALHFFEVQILESDIAQSKKGAKKRRKSQPEEIEIIVDGDRPKQQSAHGFRLASGVEDGKVYIWDLVRRKRVATLESHVSVVRSLDFSTSENALVSASRDKTVIVWDARSWKPRRVIPVFESVEATGFLQSGSVIYTGGENGRLRLWETADGREITEEQEIRSEGEGIVDIIYHEGLPFILTVQGDQSLVLHALESLSTFSKGQNLPPLPELRRISGTHDEIIDLVYAGQDHSYMALATNSESVRIISLAATPSNPTTDSTEGTYFGADVGLLRGHQDIVICLDTDWSGQWIATGAKDNTARLWHIKSTGSSFTCHCTFTGHAESLGAISLPKIRPTDIQSDTTAVEPPPYLLTGSQDRTIKKWIIPPLSNPSKSAARALYTRKAHDKDINSIAIHPTQPLFASASQDRTAKIYSTENGEVQGILKGHRRGVWSIEFAPNSIGNIPGIPSARGFVATGSGDKTLKIWSLHDYSCVRTFEGHTSSVLKALWLPSSNSVPRLASSGGDGLVKIWDASEGECLATLDNHTDRVWALAVHPSDTGMLVSGAADAVITFWRDTSSETAAKAAAKEEEFIEQDQALQNYMRASDYRSAITLALQLEQPGRLLKIFQDVLNAPKEEGSLSGVRAVDEVLAHLSDSQLLKLLKRCRDWNTNARAVNVAQRILACLIRMYPSERLTRLRGVREVFKGLESYTERHLRRVEGLLEESWIVEYTRGEMDGLNLGRGEGAGLIMER